MARTGRTSTNADGYGKLAEQAVSGLGWALGGFMICAVCGHEVDQAGTKAPRLFHPVCNQLRNHLDATLRAAREWAALKPTAKARSDLRRELFVATNRMAAITQFRDSRGRFTRS